MKHQDEKDGIAVHVSKHNHQINWDEASVETTETSYWKRRVQETVCIRISEPTINLDCGLGLSNTWLKLCWSAFLDFFSTPPTIIILFITVVLNQLFLSISQLCDSWRRLMSRNILSMKSVDAHFLKLNNPIRPFLYIENKVSWGSLWCFQGFCHGFH